MSLTKRINDCGISPKLCRAVIRQLGGDRDEALDTLRDVCRGGANAGFPGFTYYKDTSEFFRQNRSEIVVKVKQMASDLGEEPMDMVAGFGCLTDDAETRESIGRCLYGGRLTDDDTKAENALAWFALEEVARALADD